MRLDWSARNTGNLVCLPRCWRWGRTSSWPTDRSRDFHNLVHNLEPLALTGDHGIRVKERKFNIVSLVALGVSYATFVVLSTAYPSVPPQVPQVIGIIHATLVNYFLNSYWTFKHVDV